MWNFIRKISVAKCFPIAITVANCPPTVTTVLMGLNKACDCLPHSHIAKLATYGFEDSATSLMSEYLSKRYQRIKIGSVLSSYLDNLRGVQQG